MRLPIAAVVVVAGLVTAAPASALDRWWLGRSFEGLPLTHEEPGLVVYGDCELEPGEEGGCAAPLQIQYPRTRQRNPVALDIAAGRLYRVRGGGIAAEFGDGIDLLTGGSTVTVFSTSGQERRAVRQLRRRRASTAPPTLRPPHFPWPVLAELKRVQIAEGKYGSRRAISRATGVSPGRVRVRLRMVELLGSPALAEVAPPGISWRAVQRLRQIAFEADESGLRYAMKQYGVSRAFVRRALR